jgi:acyl dehydratase
MSLAPLYVKAAVGAVGPRASELPDAEIARSVAVDRARLAEYARVCGFRVDDTMPPTYPQVLGFALQVELMAARSFPLALPGLVHIRNTITAHRRIDASEPLDLRVHAERFVAHPKGAQVDLVTRVSVAGEDVWDGRSTYLARGASAPAAGEERADVPAVDPHGPPTAVWRVDAGTGRRYAHVSGDVNPIHLHPLTAKAFGFPRAIAHGMWTAARALASLQGRLPDALTFDVAFGKPLLLPSTVELRTRMLPDGWALDVRSGDTPHMRATVRPSPSASGKPRSGQQVT